MKERQKLSWALRNSKIITSAREEEKGDGLRKQNDRTARVYFGNFFMR